MVLRRIKYDRYDELRGMIDPNAFMNKENNQIVQNVESYAEDILINNKKVELAINPAEYIKIIEDNKSMGDASKLIAAKLHQEFVIDGEPLPRNLMYEKEVWTYLNLTIFFDVVRKKYMYDDSGEKKLGKIEKYYFNSDNKIDRTGLRYLWVLADLTYFDNGYELTNIAWDFTDTFKALQECEVGKNPAVLKAFALAIKELKFDKRIRNQVNRTLIPLHLRNYACPNMLDSYGKVVELSHVLAGQMELLLNNAKLQEEQKKKKTKKKDKKKKK